MKLATTTDDFKKYASGYKERVQYVCEAGFKYIDLGMYTISENDELLVSEDWRDNAKRLKEYTDSMGAVFVQAHGPGGNPLDFGVSYDRLLKATIRSVKVCKELGIPNIVIHSGVMSGVGKEEYFEKNMRFFSALFPVMEETGVNVLCENSTKANTGDMYFINSGDDVKSFVEYVNHPLFHACWDTGHANIEGNQYDEITALGKDLYAVHINDNRGTCDEHLLPFMGTLNIDEIMHALIDNNYTGYFTFEAASVLRPADYWLGNRRSFSNGCQLSEPQLFMQKHLERLMYDTGVYILKKYSCYED